MAEEITIFSNILTLKLANSIFFSLNSSAKNILSARMVMKQHLNWLVAQFYGALNKCCFYN